MKIVKRHLLELFYKLHYKFFGKSELAKKMLSASAAISSSNSWRSDYKNLWDAEVRVFSQWGEDGILNYLLDLAEISKPRIIEFGAGNFSECNSRFPAEYRNASVYAIDMRKDLLSNVNSLDINWKNHIYPVVDFITPSSAISHLEKANRLLGGVDVLSMDIDGNDYWVLNSLNLTEIEILVCEYNPLYGPKRSCTVTRDDKFDRTLVHTSWLHFGMSLRASINLMEKNNLIFVGTNRVGNNAFFVRDRIAKKIPFDIPNIHDLNKFTDWRVREGRGTDGELNYFGNSERQSLLADCELYDLDSNSLFKASELIIN
jgi:hypothetical protein